MPTRRHPPHRTRRPPPHHQLRRKPIRRTTRRPTIRPCSSSRPIRMRRRHSRRTRQPPKTRLRRNVRRLRNSSSNRNSRRRRRSPIMDRCRPPSSIRCHRSRTRRSRLPIRASRRRATHRRTTRSRAMGRRSRTRRCRFLDSRTFRTRKSSWPYPPSLRIQCTVRKVVFWFYFRLYFCKQVCGLAPSDYMSSANPFVYTFLLCFMRISMYSLIPPHFSSFIVLPFRAHFQPSRFCYEI